MECATNSTLSGWVRRVRCEFSEMPGLHLSKRQAQRLWNLDRQSAEAIFDELEAEHYLKRTTGDMYKRADLDY